MTGRGSNATIPLEGLLAASRDDYSCAFAELRGQLTDSRGVRLVDYVRTLDPIYWRVYVGIGYRFAAWAAVIALVCVGQSAGVPQLLLMATGGVLIAFFQPAAFIHEAAHGNLAADRRTNDLVCNVLLSWIIALEINFYRKVHFAHHRLLGTAQDTEHSYFLPLNIAFMIKGMSGIFAAQALWSYARASGNKGNDAASIAKPVAIGVAPYLVLIGSIVIHGSIAGILWWFGQTAASGAWIFGIGVMLPFSGTVRQVLEHRSDDARVDIDYSKVDQGACSRIFGDGFFATHLGSAGFNRHLLHHWEPQVSYTRLADLERFLADTPMRIVMERRRMSYAAAFRNLFSFK